MYWIIAIVAFVLTGVGLFWMNRRQWPSVSTKPSGPPRPRLRDFMAEERERETIRDNEAIRLRRGQSIRFRHNGSEAVGIVTDVNRKKGKVELDFNGRRFYRPLDEVSAA